MNVETAKKHLAYDPDTGVLTWLKPTNRRIAKGSPAGSPNKHGYLDVMVAGERDYAHRIAWMLMTGEQPPEQIDHRNHQTADNRWDNIRAAPGSINQENRIAAASTNKLGILGVSTTRKGKFFARIKVGPTHLHLGVHDTSAAAHGAYVAAKREHHKGGLL